MILDASRRCTPCISPPAESGRRPEGWAAAEAVYRCFAAAIAAGLPFPYCLARGAPSYYSTTGQPVVHILCTEKIAVGTLLRLPGESLWRSRGCLSGTLSELVPAEEGATCYTCLRIACAHSIVEWQGEAS